MKSARACAMMEAAQCMFRMFCLNVCKAAKRACAMFCLNVCKAAKRQVRKGGLWPVRTCRLWCVWLRAQVSAGAGVKSSFRNQRCAAGTIAVQKSAVRSWYALGPFFRRYPWLLSESRKCMKLPTSRRRSVNTLRSAATVNRELYLQMTSGRMK
jgi:hypothetical protein